MRPQITTAGPRPSGSRSLAGSRATTGAATAGAVSFGARSTVGTSVDSRFGSGRSSASSPASSPAPPLFRDRLASRLLSGSSLSFYEERTESMARRRETRTSRYLSRKTRRGSTYLSKPSCSIAKSTSVPLIVFRLSPTTHVLRTATRRRQPRTRAFVGRLGRHERNKLAHAFLDDLLGVLGDLRVRRKVPFHDARYDTHTSHGFQGDLRPEQHPGPHTPRQTTAPETHRCWQSAGTDPVP